MGEEKRPYVVRINPKNEVDDSIVVGDVVYIWCFVGVVIGFTDKEHGQYRVAVENGNIEDWINPEKVKGIHFELHTVTDIMDAIQEIIMCKGRS